MKTLHTLCYLVLITLLANSLNAQNPDPIPGSQPNPDPMPGVNVQANHYTQFELNNLFGIDKPGAWYSEKLPRWAKIVPVTGENGTTLSKIVLHPLDQDVGEYVFELFKSDDDLVKVYHLAVIVDKDQGTVKAKIYLKAGEATTVELQRIFGYFNVKFFASQKCPEWVEIHEEGLLHAAPKEEDVGIHYCDITIAVDENWGIPADLTIVVKSGTNLSATIDVPVESQTMVDLEALYKIKGSYSLFAISEGLPMRIMDGKMLWFSTKNVKPGLYPVRLSVISSIGEQDFCYLAVIVGENPQPTP